ncbi:MAG: HAMP domain-containing protein [Chloroflexi bacterium]|nr:MAG: HAMP domain-containing protein [Chloroflexota bacterium]TMC26905.1 MAG: HAMP domain-containing protein [Chloroflexota bacterium]TMC36927.1 MAG: HAMP domain-containing protein [Chloroflexota bacterium]TMC55142.1 MAG: HAMP domain-containing protein [Chloroflexota bacterium]TME37425.1 MAG: HAMP domain-containing protein [Chloroflexota bacterium]
MSILRPRFWQKVLAALLIVGVVPIALVSAISIQNTRNNLTTLGVTNIQQRSTSSASAIDAYLQSRLGDIILVGKLPDVVRFGQNLRDTAAKNAARQALVAAAARSPEYESIAVVDPDGTIVAASIQTDEGTSVKFREYFLTALKGTPYISDPSYSVITNKPALFFSAPITDGKLVYAVVRTRVNMAAVWDIVETDAGSVGEGAHGFLVDDYGIRLAVSETKGHRDQAESLIYKPIAPIEADTAKKLAADKRFGQKTPEQLVIDPLPTLKTALDALPKGKSTTAQFSYGAGVDEQRGVVTRLVAKPWAYILAVPITTYTKAADDATFNALSVVVIGLLLSFVIGVLLTRSLVGPLRRLVGDATAVSTGDVDLRVAAFDTRTGDDITREVASAFDRMLNALRFYALSDEPAGGDD